MENHQNSKHISEFYDLFSDHQKNIGLNIRIRTIFKNLKKEGLKRDSSILEIGCGIGILTKLMGNFVSLGKIISTDISSKSIEVAKSRNKKLSNVEFYVSDMSDFIYECKFDFVVMADVLEHIPVENHNELFKNISQHLHPNSKVVINIPSPYHIEWQQKFEPGTLQIIDQPLPTNVLLPAMYQNNLYLYTLKTYSLFFQQGDYQWIILKMYENVDNFRKKSKNALRVQEIKSRLTYL